MPSPASTPVRGEGTAREPSRRDLVTWLSISEATCRYGASHLASGIGPAEARATALFVAGELTAVAGALRRLTLGDDPGERGARAVELAGLGWSRGEIAEALGVSDRAVRGYLAGG